MIREFIEVPLFTKRWKEIGLDDAELKELQIMLLKDPESGPVMEGTGGIRWTLPRHQTLAICFPELTDLYTGNGFIEFSKRNPEKDETDLKGKFLVQLLKYTNKRLPKLCTDAFRRRIFLVGFRNIFFHIILRAVFMHRILRLN